MLSHPICHVVTIFLRDLITEHILSNGVYGMEGYHFRQHLYSVTVSAAVAVAVTVVAFSFSICLGSSFYHQDSASVQEFHCMVWLEAALAFCLVHSYVLRYFFFFFFLFGEMTVKMHIVFRFPKRFFSWEVGAGRGQAQLWTCRCSKLGNING